MTLPRWLRLVALVAVLRIAAGLPGPWMAAQPLGRPPFAVPAFFAIVVFFAATSLFLILGGRGDRRAHHLAVLYLLAAIPFTDGLLALVAAGLPGAATAALAVRSLQVDAFLPYVFWAFVEDFPRVRMFGRASRLPLLARRLTLGLGVLLLSANVLVFLFALASLPLPAASLLQALDRMHPQSSYYPLLFVLVLPAVVFALWKTRKARIEEKRRARLLMCGVAISTFPTAVITILKFGWPVFDAYVSVPPGMSVARAIAYPTLLAVPLITAYAVLVQDALDVRLVIRKAIQYALARYGVWTLAVVPFGALLLFLYANRAETLGAVVSGWSVLVLASATAAGVTTVRFRHRAFDAIDRVFFREQYDARRLLRDLIQRSREVGDVNQLVELLCEELERALHVEAPGFCLLDRSRGVLVSSRNDIRPLELSSELARRLADEGWPHEVDWGLASGLLHGLPLADQHWLADAGFRLLVPLLDSRGGLIGLLGLGDKRSELPYSGEDKSLLASIATSAALTLENRMLQASYDSRFTAKGPARECVPCGRVRPTDAERCDSCGEHLSDARIPLILAGKYKVLERLGEGGMGVVYRAVDLTLARDVAIKTLPRVSPAHSQRMRREARAMAAVDHVNLALIFAVEFWLGTPLLVVEYLPGGTLAERLRGGPLSIPAAIHLASTLAEVAECIHGAGIIHRDIKPSNIGYARDGTLKLLDFGLARIFQVASGEQDGLGDRMAPRSSAPALRGLLARARSLPAEALGALTTPGVVVGTLSYMSPEAVTGEPPDPSFDVWSISVLLYELVSGRNPVGNGSPHRVLARIVEVGFPDVREFRPDAPEGLAALLRGCLALERERRPASAAELHHRLQVLPAARPA